MSDIQEKDYNLEKLIKENKIKRLRNKDSYMDAFLERRRQAANFALERKNAFGCKYSKPVYYINEGNKLLKKQKSGKNDINENENKKEFYKTYNILKKNLTGKNNSINNNIIFIEKENNKYYLSQDFPKNNNYKSSNYKKYDHHCCEHCNHKNNNYKNKNQYVYYMHEDDYGQNFYDDLMPNEEINKKYNNIKHHSINIPSKNKNKKVEKKEDINTQYQHEIFSKTDNGFGNNLKIEKAGISNYYFYDKDDKGLSTSSPYNNTNQNYKYKSTQNLNRNSNTCLISTNKIKEIDKNKGNSDKNIYYEGTDNHTFYDSSKMNNNKYNYNTYKIKNKILNENNIGTEKFYSKNLSEPKNIDRNKNYYVIKAYKNSVDSDYNKKIKIGNNQLNDISPIRTYCRYEYEDNNDDLQNIEKIYDSQSLIENSINNMNINNSNKKFKYNIKLQNNYFNNNNNMNIIDNNDKGNRTKSVDMQVIHSAQIIKDTPNTKSVSIVYKPQKNSINNVNDNINIKNYESDINNKNEIIEIINDDRNIKDVKILKNKGTLISIKKEEDTNNTNNINISKNKVHSYTINSNDKKNEKEINNKNETNKENIITTDNKNNNEENKEIMTNTNTNNKNNNEGNKEVITNTIIINENKEDKQEKEEKLKSAKNVDDSNNNKKNEIEKEKNAIDNLDSNNIIKINKNGRNQNKNELNNINNDNYIYIKESGIDEYPKIVDQEQNYETIKEKYESFLRQKDEKEPNTQSKIMNSMLTSKEESNLLMSNNNLIKNIKEKIQILKNNNNNKNNKEYINYSNEIDDYFIKIKQKEEKNNLALNEFYQELLKKEMDNDNNNNNNRDININYINNIDANELNKEINNQNEIKKIIIQKSNRLQHMMKNILNNKKHHKYVFNNYYTISNRINPSKTFYPKNENEEFKEMTLKNNFNNIKFSKYNKAPDINLIVDEDDGNYIKIIDENEYTKLKKKNTKSSRPINIMNKKLKDPNQIMPNYRDRLNYFGFYNYGSEKFNINKKLLEKEKYIHSFSPKALLCDNKNKIMPPNEI